MCEDELVTRARPRLALAVAEYRFRFAEWPTHAHGRAVMAILSYDIGVGCTNLASRLICVEGREWIAVSGPSGKCSYGLVERDSSLVTESYRWLYGEDPDWIQSYKCAAEYGHGKSALRLANMLFHGSESVRDTAAAVRYYRMAAEEGSRAARFQLGYLYLTGDGVKKNTKIAARWFQEAAEKGHSKAQLELGILYAAGDGVARDLVTAYMWYDVASVKKELAVSMRDTLALAMTADEINEARRRAARYASPSPRFGLSLPPSN